MNTLIQDLRFAVRQVRRSPGFALTAVFTLALGIGVNTAMFSLLDQALLRSLPVRRPQQLAVLRGTGDAWQGSTNNWGGGVDAYFSYPMYRDLRDKDTAFQGMLATVPAQVNLAGQGTPRIQDVEMVSGNYFTVLGVTPAVGRVFRQSDDTLPGGNPVAVASFEFWQRALGGNPGAVGSTLSINGRPFLLLGVAAPGFRSAAWGKTPGLYLPMSMIGVAIPGAASRLTDRTNRWLNILARVNEGETLAQAQAQSAPLWYALRAEELKALGTQSPRFRSEFLDRSRLLVQPAASGFSYNRDTFRAPLLAVMGMAALVLLIAVVNVGSLLLVRSVARVREFSLRQALGASAHRLLAQLLLEGLLLGVTGGAVGLLLAPLAMHAVVSRLADDSGLAPFNTVLDSRVLVFSFAVAVLASLLFSLAPALQLRRRDLTTTLRQNSATGAGGVLLLRRSIVGVQIGLSLLLLMGAGLFVRTVQQMRADNVGFRSDHLVVFGVSPQLAGYTEARLPALRRTLREALLQIPGVTAVGITTDPELAGNSSSSNFTFQGFTPPPDSELSFENSVISATYLPTLGAPLVAGRMLTEQDDAQHAHVALVNETLARRIYGLPQRAVGQRMAFGTGNHMTLDTEIVGVVRDHKHEGLRAPVAPTVYRPMAQQESTAALAEWFFYVRGKVPPATLLHSVQRQVAGVDATLALDGLHTMEEQIDSTLQNERLIALLATAFGVLAAVLAGVGLYGVLAFVTAGRTREIGVRMALGASRVSVGRLVLADVLRMALGGVAVGLPVALVLARLLRSQLYNVSPADPVSLMLAVFALALVAVLASALPARRAASVNPTEALRTE